MRASVPPNESERLAVLHDFHILDTPPELAYDDITALAASLFETPMALVSLVDAERQWFKSRHGTPLQQTPRDLSFCAHAILQPEDVTVAHNLSTDPRFADHPLVDSTSALRFYAGAPLISREKQPLGTLCILDRRPRTFSSRQRRHLHALSRQTMAHLETKRDLARLRREHVWMQQEIARLQQDNTDLQNSNRFLRELSTTDALTGLKNQRAFHDALHGEWARSMRYGVPFSLILLDVDHFKAYNDAFGHPAGDNVLRQLATLLKMTSRDADIVARYGGEEFALVMPRTDALAAGVAAQRLRQAIEDYSWPRRPVTASLGVATAQMATHSRHTLLEQADGALYQAKRAGRNRIVQVQLDEGKSVDAIRLFCVVLHEDSLLRLIKCG